MFIFVHTSSREHEQGNVELSFVIHVSLLKRSYPDEKLQSTVKSKQTDYPLGMLEVKGSCCGSNDKFHIHLSVRNIRLKMKRSGYEHPSKQNLIFMYQYTMVYDVNVNKSITTS